MKHPFLIIAAALAVLCAVALATPWAWILAIGDLAIAGLLLFGVIRASRNATITTSVIALAGSLLVALMLGGMEFEGTDGSLITVVMRTTKTVLIFGAFVSNALVALSIALDLFFSRWWSTPG